MNSTTGRIPSIEAPTASPENAASLIGVSTILEDRIFPTDLQKLCKSL